MRPFLYDRASSLDQAAQSVQDGPLIQGRPPSEFLAGGTTLIDLMKLDVMRPTRVIDISGAGKAHAAIRSDQQGLRLGALVTMSAAAGHPEIVKTYPALAQSLSLAASAQLRNMATLGGNVLQRTRCNYFRDPSWSACNKRNPGSGCAALEGLNRQHAVLGNSRDCIAVYPSDFAQALLIYEASVEILGPNGPRTLPFDTLHRQPGSTPNIETVLQSGDVITGFSIAAAPWTKRSLYLKIRDRQSYEFALASAALRSISTGVSCARRGWRSAGWRRFRGAPGRRKRP